MTSAILAIDIGTSSTKGLLVSEDGLVLASHSVAYAVKSRKAGYAEQDPEEILAAVIRVAKEASSRGDVLGIVLSSPMHSLLLADHQNRPLTPILTWADQRSADVASRLRQEDERLVRGLHLRTGTPVHAMSPLCKLIWLRQNEPLLFNRAARFLSIKELMLEALTGQRLVDQSVASSTGLFDVHKLAWDKLALELAGVHRANLSPLVPTTHTIDGLRPAIALEIGLPPTTKVVVGATDGVLANLGVGAVGPGSLCVTLGTSGAARVVVGKPRTDPEGRLFCYVLAEGEWVLGGAINNAGLLFSWLADQYLEPSLDQRQKAAALIAMAEAVPAGADGLLCLPLLAGERFPYYSSDVRGIYVGLSVRHRKGHMVRAALEGMMLAITSLVAEIEERAGPMHEVRVGGGLLEWPLCRQMLADMLEKMVVMPGSVESTAMGAAWLGLKALGRMKFWKQTSAVSLPHQHGPNARNHELYMELAQLKRECETANRELMRKLARRQEQPRQEEPRRDAP